MKNIITTSDIYFTAALIALGAKLDSVDKSDPRHMQFTVVRQGYEFQSDNLPEGSAVASMQIDLEEYEKQWVNGTLIINAVAYKNSIQQMKSVIHSK